MKCILPVDINECPFFNRDKLECNNQNRCTYQENENVQQKEKYIRQERWYEKYYKQK